ncbi:autotransporter family protein [Serratia fonticola]|uniref:autotransporter family protein n=1 Tax=Serratia fonticola TaxID=47917 RepID=UPI002178AB17|nr:autotransporter outer membrane beta-barrel domain-containing protein [Serratia fonticola]CAI1741524.1 Outer membrane protein IcsA autotransporter precursor [Serratia fonticola]
MAINRKTLIVAGIYLATSPAIASTETLIDYSSRPDAGVYLGNQVAASTLFSHTLHQRKTAPGDSQFWMRVSGYHSKDLSAGDNGLPVDMDRQVFMLGGDLLALDNNKEEWTAGLMTGYGHAKSSANNATLSSEGKVDGYSIGAYSTWYQDKKKHSGAYVDTWLQYAWFNNSVTYAQGKQNYDSTGFSASLETGYALQPFSALELIIEPQLQIIYNRFDADNYQDPAGVYIHQADAPNFTSRVGIRWYSDQDDYTTAYLATNWWHNSGKNTVNFNDTRVESNSLDDLFEVKLGLHSPSTYNMQLWFEGGITMGANSYQDYGGTLGVSYRW